MASFPRSARRKFHRKTPVSERCFCSKTGVFGPNPALFKLVDQSGDRAAAGFVSLPHEPQGLFHLGVVVDLRGVRRGVPEGGRGVVAAHQQREEGRGRVSQLVRRPMPDQVGFRTALFPHPLVRPFDRSRDVGAVAVLRVEIVVVRLRLRRFASQALGAFEPCVMRAEQRFVGLLAAGVPFENGDLVFPEGDHARLVVDLGLMLEGHINPAVGIPLHELLERHPEKLGGPHAADPLQNHHVADRGQKVRKRLDDLRIGHILAWGVFPRLALFQVRHVAQPDRDVFRDQLVRHAELEHSNDVGHHPVDVVPVVVRGAESFPARFQGQRTERFRLGGTVQLVQNAHGGADRGEVGIPLHGLEESGDQLGDGQAGGLFHDRRFRLCRAGFGDGFLFGKFRGRYERRRAGAEF